MIGRRHGLVNVQLLAHGTPKIGGEFAVSIRDYVSGESVVAVDVPNIEVDELRSCDCFWVTGMRTACPLILHKMGERLLYLTPLYVTSSIEMKSIDTEIQGRRALGIKGRIFRFAKE